MKAWELLTKYGHCTRDYAQDDNNIGCDIDDPYAANFCAEGAIIKCYANGDVDNITPEAATCLVKLRNRVGFIPFWNDKTPTSLVIKELKDLDI